jgi:hypothetical protein
MGGLESLVGCVFDAYLGGKVGKCGTSSNGIEKLIICASMHSFDINDVNNIKLETKREAIHCTPS